MVSITTVLIIMVSITIVLTIDEDNTIVIDNQLFGHYTLKEIKAGVGYNLNTNNFEFTIDKDNLINDLTIENEVIKKKISIYKTYGTKNNQKKEANIELIFLMKIIN